MKPFSYNLGHAIPGSGMMYAVIAVSLLIFIQNPLSAAWVAVDNNGAYKAFCMAAAPHVNKVYFEEDGVRLHVSSDNGTTWTPLANTTTNGKAFDASILQLVFDPADTTDNTFWAGGTYGSAGIYYTTDGGSSWLALAFAHTQNFAIDFSDPQRKTILAGSHTGEFTMSKDGGATCASAAATVQAADTGITSFGNPMILDSNTFLVRTGNGAGWGGTDGIFRTTDAGATWKKVCVQSISQQILIDKRDGSFIGCLPWTRGLIRSTDQGQRWLPRIGYGILESGVESMCATYIGDASYVHIKKMTTSGNQQLSISTNYVTFTDFLEPFPATGMNLADQTVGVVYSKPGNMLYTFTRYGKISRYDMSAVVLPKSRLSSRSIQGKLSFKIIGNEIPSRLINNESAFTLYDINGKSIRGNYRGSNHQKNSVQKVYIAKAIEK